MVKTDIAEKDDVAVQHPKIIGRLSQAAHIARSDLGQGTQKGANVRPISRVENTTPRIT